MLNNDLLRESVLMDALPDELMNLILRNKTSLGNNPALPEVFENSFLERVLNKRFNETVEELKKIGRIDDVEETQLENALSHLIRICQEEERPYRQALEKLCMNYIINLFDIPDDIISMELSLVDEVDLTDESIQLDPIYGDDEEYESLSDITTLKDEIFKRRLLNVLAMGAGMQLSANIKSYLSDVYDINPKLPDLYRKILALNNYLLFTREIELTDDDKKQMGSVLVQLHNVDEITHIIAQGKIFPVLLSESIRGLMDLFGSHGLPSDRDMAFEVMGKADYLKAEPWDMRIGPSLWILLSDSFTNVDSNLIPYLYKTIAKLSPKNFNRLISEIFAKTRTGNRLMAKVIAKAKEEKDYDNFDVKMSNLKVDKSLLSDEINPDEL